MATVADLKQAVDRWLETDADSAVWFSSFPDRGEDYVRAQLWQFVEELNRPCRGLAGAPEGTRILARDREKLVAVVMEAGWSVAMRKRGEGDEEAWRNVTEHRSGRSRGPYRLWVYYDDSEQDEVRTYLTKREFDRAVSNVKRFEQESEDNQGVGWSGFDAEEWRRLAEDNPELARRLYELEERS